MARIYQTLFKGPQKQDKKPWAYLTMISWHLDPFHIIGFLRGEYIGHGKFVPNSSFLIQIYLYTSIWSYS